MADKQEIIEREDQIRQATHAVKSIVKLIRLERLEYRGRFKDENKDCWATLRVNVLDLQHNLERLLEFMQKG